MSAPALWGIDPDCLYPWTPRAGRIKVKEAVFQGDKLVSSTEYGAAQEGAPVLLLAPLTEAMSMRCAAAHEKYSIAYARAIGTVLHGGDTDAAADAAAAKLDSIYTPELIRDVLSACVNGWRNLKTRGGREIAFSGDWEKDGAKIPASWRAELFQDIVNESAFTEEEVQGFTSPLGSTAD